MALYIVYVEEMDNEEHEWAVELSDSELDALHRRLEKLERHYVEIEEYFSWSVVLLVDQGQADLNEWLAMLEDNIGEEEDAPAVHAGS